MKRFNKKWLLVLFSLMLIVGIVVGFTVPTMAATSAVITITDTPQYIAISISPSTWAPNSETGNSHTIVNTTYYSNPTGSTTSPTVGGATDAQCAFTITNTSNVAIDLTVTWSNGSGGNASTNANSATAGASSFGASGYFSGQASGSWGVYKSSGNSTANGYSNLAATTNIKCGLILAEQTGAWSSSTAQTETVTYVATAH
jgi:hypothetical protein